MAPHSPPTALRLVGALARAVLAAAALAALLVGAPYAMLRWGHLPTSLPTLSAVKDFLSGPADDSVLLTVLTLIGLVAWAFFIVVPVVLEVGALLRHRAAPRVRALSPFQGAASFLVGSIVLLAPTAASAATAAATPAAAASAPQHASQAGPDGRTAAPTRADQTVRYVATGHDTLWDIAQTHLGNGLRWREIAALNPDLADPLVDGTIVRLPADARTADPAANTAHTDEAQAKPIAPTTRTYTVRTGDDLSDIAQHQLGDAGAWPRIYDLNKGEALPDGDRFTDPDLVFPGQHLDLPTAGDAPTTPDATPPSAAPGSSSGHQHAAATPPPTAPAPTASNPAAGLPQQTPAPTATPSATESGPAANSATPSPVTTTPPSSTPSTPQASPSDTAASPTAAQPPHLHATTAESGDSRSTELFALGGALLAASVLTALASRRILQQRRRRPGRRIAMPKSTAAATELAMRTVQAPDGTEFIDTALRTAAVHLAATDRELPDLAAALYNEQGLTLHLAEPAAPVAPFAAVDGDLARWHAPSSRNELLGADEVDNTDAPYPALVTLGIDPDGRTVLVDLERYGSVRISGPRRHQVMRALAVELATSTLADHIDLTMLGPACPGLPALLPERCTEHPDQAAALRAIVTHHNGQQQALATAGASTLRQARLGAETAAAWTPHIILAAEQNPAAEVTQELAAVTRDHPRTATVILTTNPNSTSRAGDGLWSIVADGGLVRLPDVDLVCTLQELSEQDYTDVLDIIATSAPDTPDVPAPQEPQRLEAIPDQVVTPDHDRPTAPTSGTTPAPSVPSPRDDDGKDADGLMAAFADLGTSDSEEVEAGEPVSEASPRPTPSTSASAAQTTEPNRPAAPDAAGPVIRLLGPVDITGAGTTERRYLRTLTEIAAWMVLHPGLDHRALDEAIWPGRDVSRKTRNPWISRLRSWLGTAADGTAHLPPIATTDDARYRLAETVTSDWHHFQTLVADGSDHSLHQALQLVRGRPFAAIPPRRYVWAEPLMQEMIAAIVDAAAELAERNLADSNPRAAIWAATKGLDAAPESELLYRALFRGYHAIGDHDALERAALRLDELNTALGCDMEEATAETLHRLLTPA
ncbi:LysM peptidoglycan-binding domain-containing protein [Streptomyces sp. NPDC020096]